MAIISYAQNFEDVMLWRCFKDIEKGFYIDIGANHPIEHSVSLAFYNHGWRGINIEPTSQFTKLLREARPDETVIQAALGNERGEINFYEFPSTGLSTTNINIAHQHENDGFKFIETKTQQITLDDVLSDINHEVHWLKIDVEGAEKNVLEGWCNSSIRPWVLVIESTLPMSELESYQCWEKIVLDKGYEFVYFDGLNRFYLSDQHLNLKKHFQAPPNIFDGHIQKSVIDLQDLVEREKLNSQGIVIQLEDVKHKLGSMHEQLIEQEDRLKRTQEQLKNTQSQLKDTQKQLINAQEQLINTQRWAKNVQDAFYHMEYQVNVTKERNNHLELQISNILASFYWRITFPLRWLKSKYNIVFLKKSVIQTGESLKNPAKSTINRIIISTNRYPRLRLFLVKALKLTGAYEFMYKWRLKMSDRRTEQEILENITPAQTMESLTSSAQRVFNLLEKAKINQIKKGVI